MLHFLRERERDREEKLPGQIYAESELQRIGRIIKGWKNNLDEDCSLELKLLLCRAWEQGFGAARASKTSFELNTTESKEFPGLTEAQVETVKDEPSLLRAVRLFRDYTHFGLVEAVPLVRKIRGYKDAVREDV